MQSNALLHRSLSRRINKPTSAPWRPDKHGVRRKSKLKSTGGFIK